MTRRLLSDQSVMSSSASSESAPIVMVFKQSNVHCEIAGSLAELPDKGNVDVDATIERNQAAFKTAGPKLTDAIACPRVVRNGQLHSEESIRM